MAITLERRPKGTYPLVIFHTSFRSIYRQKMGSNGIYQFGYCPRKCEFFCLDRFYEKHDSPDVMI